MWKFGSLLKDFCFVLFQIPVVVSNRADAVCLINGTYEELVFMEKESSLSSVTELITRE